MCEIYTTDTITFLYNKYRYDHVFIQYIYCSASCFDMLRKVPYENIYMYPISAVPCMYNYIIFNNAFHFTTITTQIPLGFQLKDENKTEDMVEIMAELQ